ncbi:MAG: PilZ domain-containing protein [Magnetovibrionaceae bacterium]
MVLYWGETSSKSLEFQKEPEPKAPVAKGNKRGFPRFQMSDLKAVIKNHKLPVADISAEGLLIEQTLPGLEEGDSITFHLLIDLLDRPMKVVIQAFVVRNHGGKLALTYARPGPTWHRVLAGLARHRS